MIEIDAELTIRMTGPVEPVLEGTFDPVFVNGLEAL